MKQIFYSIILLFICDVGGFITNNKHREFIYKFSNNIIASNVASNKVLSQWTYSGILIVQDYNDYKIFKLDNIKTSLFNGKRNRIKVNETNLSDAKKILTHPFGVYHRNLSKVNISVASDDELWSINIKKSIASSFLIDTSIEKRKTDTEELIFGKCSINLEVIYSGSKKIIEKTINHETCVKRSMRQSSNVDWIKNNHSPLQHKTKRTYLLLKNNSIYSINSSSNFTLQTSPDVISTNRLEQNQYFELLTVNENTKPLKIHNNTITKNLRYEEVNIKNNQTNQNVYLNNFIHAYEKFKIQINEKPLHFSDTSTSSPLIEMLSNLKKFDENSLRKLLNGTLTANDTQYYEIILGMIPYVGNKYTMNLIKFIIEDKIDLLTKVKFLVTFSDYIQEINEETVKNFEELLTIESVETDIKRTAILSFVSMISKGNEKNTINNEIVERYMKKFYDKFLNAQKYENKMIYLLALINMSEIVPLNTILNIIHNQKENRHIQELAIYGFKNRLKQFGAEIFHTFWQIVISSNAIFETRIAALDLLLSCEISEKQFNEIVSFSERNKELNNPFDEHISNYIVTTIISLQNNTGYQHYLGKWATNSFQTKKMHQNLRTWSTGNYRFAFNDDNSNFGFALQTKLISDPKTNTINVIQISYNQFAMSMNLGEYHVYIKLEGVLDLIFANVVLSKKLHTPSMHDLIQLIKHCKYQLKDRDNLFIDVVVFSTNRALFALHIDKNNYESSESKILESLLKFMAYHQLISYPILNEIIIPSDLGTEIKITYYMQQVIFQEYKIFLNLFQSNTNPKIDIKNKMFVQMTETINSNNPLDDVNIYVEKLQYDFKILELPLSINTSDLSISWCNKNDSFNWIKQNKIYTFINNNTALKEHCNYCNEIEEIPTGESKAECIEEDKCVNQCRMDHSIWREKLINIFGLGVSINITGTKESEEMEKLRRMKQYGVNEFTEVINSHRGNTLTFPLVQPFLYFLHLIWLNRYLNNDLNEFSVRNSIIYDEAYTTNLKLTFNQKYKYNTITGFNENCTLELMNIRNKNNDVLSGAKLTFGYATNVATNNSFHVETNFTIIADIWEPNDQKKKFCLNHKMIYPNQLGDILSIEPVKPAEGVTTISWDKVKSFDDKCTHYFIKFTEMLSVNEEHNENIKKMNEYKTCKKESAGFNYTLPTESCQIAHKATSLYRDYVAYIEMYHAGMKDDNNNKHKIFEYHHINDKTINISLSRNFINLFEMDPKPEFLNYVTPSTFANYMATNPSEFIRSSDRTCDVSSQGVKTFYDKYINFNDSSQPKIFIAFADSTNVSHVCLIVNKIGKINVGFTYLSGQNKISTNIENDEMKIFLNGIEIKDNTQNDELKIYFIARDVIFISSDLVELYYSPISLSIKIPTIFYKYLSGECFQ